MKKLSALTVAIFAFSLFVTTGAMARNMEDSSAGWGARVDQLRTPVQQSPEGQTPGVIEFSAADRKTIGMSEEFYGMAQHHQEKTVRRTPVQQSPEMQSPGVVELYPAGPNARL